MAKIETTTYLFVLLLAVAVFFGWLLFKPSVEPQTPVIKVVDLSEFRSLQMYDVDGLSIVHLKVKDTDGCFLVDTGAKESIFNSKFLSFLNVSIADSIPFPNTKIVLTDTLEIRSSADSLFRFKKQFYAYNLTGLKDELSKGDSLFTTAVFFGILGQDVMKSEGMIINFQNNKMYLTNNKKK